MGVFYDLRCLPPELLPFEVLRVFTDPNSPSKVLVLANWLHQPRNTIHRLVVEKNLFGTAHRHLLQKYYDQQLLEGGVGGAGGGGRGRGRGRRQGQGQGAAPAGAAVPGGIGNAEEEDGAISDSSSASSNASNGNPDENIDEL